MGFIKEYLQRRKLRGAKDSIRRMFFARAEKFTIDTAKIIKRMPGAIDAISELIEEKETFKKGGQLNWLEVTLVDADNEENALIIIVGVVQFPIGAEVELSTGDKVLVTPDTAQYFPSRLIRIGLPLRLAEASKDEIKTYLKKTEEEQKVELEATHKSLKETLGQDTTQAPNVTKTQNDTLTTDADFDLTQLTDEQRRQLTLSQKMGRG